MGAGRDSPGGCHPHHRVLSLNSSEGSGPGPRVARLRVVMLRALLPRGSTEPGGFAVAVSGRTRITLPGNLPVMYLSSRLRIARGTWLALVAAAACAPAFKLSKYKGNAELYAAATREYKKGHWDNAIQAYERLTLDLPARDTLLPLSYWYLAAAHARKGEHLLAAQGYSRLNQTFPDDTIADDAMLAEATQYTKMWRKPALDSQYGQTALATYRTMIELYPDSPLAPQAQQGVQRMLEWLATKDYLTG